MERDKGGKHKVRDRPGIDRARHAYDKEGIEQRYIAPLNIRLSKMIKHEEKSVNQSKGKRETWLRDLKTRY